MRELILATMCALLVAIAAAGQEPIGPHSVLLCEHTDTVGECQSFAVKLPWTRYRLVRDLGAFDNRTSSILVGPDTNLHVFEYADFGGRSRTFLSGSKTVGSQFKSMTDGWNDRISSLIVVPRSTAQEPEWTGAVLTRPTMGNVGPMSKHGFTTAGSIFFPLPEQVSEREARYPTVPGALNDKATTLKICGRYVSVTLYQHPNFKGDKRDLPGPAFKPNPCATYPLGQYQFSGVVSSLVVRTSEPKVVQPMLPPPRGGPGTGTTHRAPPAPGQAPGTGTQPKAPSAPGHAPPTDTAYELPPGTRPVTLEPDTNRPGLDYTSFGISSMADDMGGPGTGAQTCQDECAKDPKCKAFTYVKPGVQSDTARCWLKHGVPPAKSMPCCVSGVKQ